MPKRQKSVGLSSDVIKFIEENRGHLSFSAYTEYLIRAGIKTMITEEVDERKRGVKTRRTLVRLR